MILRLIVAFVLASLLFVGLDVAWIFFVARSFYLAEIGGLLRAVPLPVPAFAFYGIYLSGLALFALRPGLAARSPRLAARYGAALGLVAYATYDLTAMAILDGYTWRVGLVDLAWGTISSSIAAALSTLVTLQLFKRSAA